MLVGVNVMFTAMLAPAARDPLVGVTVYREEVDIMLEITRVEPPEFVTVTDFVLGCPTATVPKSRVVGFTENAGGSDAEVVKLHVLENALVPLLFFAFTLQ